jgi:hypothetical protein
MRATWMVAAVMALAGMTTGGTAQRPNMTGTWTASQDGVPGTTPAPSPTLGPRFAIQHDGDKFTLVRPVREATMSAAFTLGGGEVRSRIPPRLCDGEPETIETAAWDGDAIAFTVVGTIPPGGGSRTTSNIRRLFKLHGPDALIVEATIQPGGGTPRQVATVYKRTQEPLPSSTAPALPAVQKAPATIAQVGWISGTWIGAAGALSIEERWTPGASGAMLATARTLRNNVMASFEFLCIVEREGSLAYAAMPNGRMPPTLFALTAITAESATFENPGHDFPQLIRYTKKADGSLETTISATSGQKAQTFVLKKQ